MNDLETRLRDELGARAEDTRAWSSTGAAVRQVHRERRVRRRRAGAAGCAALVALGVAIGLTTVRGSDDVRPTPPSEDSATSTQQPTPMARNLPSLGRLTPVTLTADQVQAAVTATMTSSKATVLFAARVASTKQTVGALVLAAPPRQKQVSTFTIDADGTVVRGTDALFADTDTVMALPVHVGTGASLAVIAPTARTADVRVISSPGGAGDAVSVAPLRRGIALLPVLDPTEVVWLGIYRGDTIVFEGVPADLNLGADVPRTAMQVVAETGAGSAQSVQIRTDGRTACRVTAGGFWPPAFKAVPWNPFDAACATIDGTLQLLLPSDRTYSTVGGVAPHGTTRVVLHWKDFGPTEPSMSTGDLPSFLDSGNKAPSALVKAEAFDDAGHLLGTARPTAP